jgi:outer membrane protein OmpA-like peptidoglycan-associated protein
VELLIMKKHLLLLALLACGGAAAAEPAAPAGPFRPGWYVAPLATYMKPDSARCGVDAGFGAAAALGHRGDFGALELWGQFLSLPKGECSYTVPDSGNPPANPDGDLDDDRDPVTEPAGDVKLNGAGLALLVGPFFEDAVLARFFGIVGFGAIRREDHPQYATGDTTIFGDVGLGFLQPFRLFGGAAAVRAEVRYRYDVQQPPHPEDPEPAPAHEYSDLIFNLGLQFALSAAPEPVAETVAAVTVVPVADADGDGIGDDQDTCPGTATGTMVDATGCEPAPATPAAPAAEPTLQTAKAGDTIVLHGVNFETARATLTTNAKTILDGVATDLNARPELKIEVGGHTDARGNDDYNQSLSERRAQSVLDYLVGQGVDAGRLGAVGYGEGQPVDSNETDEGRERNRRVELKVLEQAPEAATPAAATPAAPTPASTPSGETS